MTVGITDSPQTSIAKLLKDNVFSVPPNQRDYRWSEDKVRQLFDDIDGALSRGDKLYFLGLMVFMKSENGDLVVLDGQQRLATVYLFLAACRNWLQQYSDLQREADQIETQFMGERKLGETEVRPRLVLNSANNPAFERYVVQAKPVEELRAALDGLKRYDRSRLLLEAAVYCHDRIAGVARQEGDYRLCAKRLIQIINFLTDQTPIVKMIVPSESAAFTIFETVNDRGIDLSPLDLVKNHLFRCVGTKEPARQRDLEHRWGQMMHNLEEAAPDQFLKAFWTSRHGRIQSHGLYDAFTREYASGAQSISISIDMLTASERYAALYAQDDPAWAPYPKEAREHIGSLRILGAQQAHPVVLAAFERFDPSEMERLLRLLEVLIVRYQFVGGGRTGALEIECAKLAYGIYERRVTDATSAHRELRAVYPSDDSFQQAFTEMREASAPKTVYLLRRLEREARRLERGAMASDSDAGANLTVEHVYPKNPSPEWPPVGGDDDDDLASRLGNLCLLPRSANTQLGGASFSTKREIYQKSDLLLTKEIAERTEWGSLQIQRRQAHLAKLAVQAWRF